MSAEAVERALRLAPDTAAAYDERETEGLLARALLAEHEARVKAEESEPPELLTQVQVARILGLSKRATQEAIAAGALEPVPHSGPPAPEVPALRCRGDRLGACPMNDEAARGASRFGRLLERNVRLMDTQTQEYVTAYIDVEHTTEGAIYVSEETTHMIVADAWSGIEKQLVDANAAFNATDDEPHERALALLRAFQQAIKYADVIYSLTPMPDDENDE